MTLQSYVSLCSSNTKSRNKCSDGFRKSENILHRECMKNEQTFFEADQVSTPCLDEEAKDSESEVDRAAKTEILHQKNSSTVHLTSKLNNAFPQKDFSLQFAFLGHNVLKENCPLEFDSGIFCGSDLESSNQNNPDVDVNADGTDRSFIPFRPWEHKGSWELCCHPISQRLEALSSPTIIPIFPVKKKRRKRSIFTQWQLECMEKEFSINHFITAHERTRLASKLALSEKQIKTWFQNRRIKFRKQLLE